jgi:hypothetical protein
MKKKGRTDVEAGVYEDGYPGLANWMAQDPDNETLIFRKFDKLSVRNILYMQAELFDLERKILEFERRISEKNDVDLMDSVRRWETFVERTTINSQGIEHELWELIIESKRKLKEYRECVRDSKNKC